MNTPNPSNDTIRALLKAHSLRVTTTRVAVLDALYAAQRPLTHAEVVELLQQSFPNIDRTTVYRNLVSLSETGILHRSELGDRLWRFEVADQHHSNDAPHTHPHFVCTDCGTVECLPQSILPKHPSSTLPASLQRGHVEVQIRGQCDECFDEPNR